MVTTAGAHQILCTNPRHLLAEGARDLHAAGGLAIAGCVAVAPWGGSGASLLVSRFTFAEFRVLLLLRARALGAFIQHIDASDGDVHSVGDIDAALRKGNAKAARRCNQR